MVPLLCLGLSVNIFSAETFVPYKAGGVPQNVTDLWKDYDARSESLEIQVHKEWKADGVVTRYVTFKVGTFKGADSRIAAYYSFPDDGKRHAAFVWSHGGGQKAERDRGIYFAKQGFATVDINWLGRSMEPDVKVNTDWGKVDPTQGPRFYSKALRQGWKRNLQPDDYTIDNVISPRNSNWFLLIVTARRAITFLEQQPGVDPEKIGFAGFSMGGRITSMAAIDSRLKAVVPMVGGSAFQHIDLPGEDSGTGLSRHFGNDVELYANTLDPSSYWSKVNCPVLFLSSSNDFNASFERVYKAMAFLNHKDWRVSMNMHANHSPEPEQWVLLNQWFNRYLKGEKPFIPVTPPSTLKRNGKTALFTVTPADQDRLIATEMYFTCDPRSRTRFWNRAAAVKDGKSWKADIEIHEKLPLYVFALCRYELPELHKVERGETRTFTLNSIEQSIVPKVVDPQALTQVRKTRTVCEDSENGLQDWSSRDGRTVITYKFQSLDLDVSDDRKLCLTIDPKGKKLSLHINTSGRFLVQGESWFSCSKNIQGQGVQKIILDRSDFKGAEGTFLKWSEIVTFEMTFIDRDTKARVQIVDGEGSEILKRFELIAAQ